MANKLKTYTRNGSLASIWSESGSSGPPSPATDVVFPHLGLSIKTDPSSVPLLQESPIDEELEKNLFPRNQVSASDRVSRSTDLKFSPNLRICT